jgi:hypothetical protein
MTPNMEAIAFLLAGGVIVGLSVAAFSHVLTSRLERFERAHREQADRLETLIRVASEALVVGDRATLVGSEIAWKLDRERQQASDATKARALTDRRATIGRLRRARARSARRGGSE